MKIRYNVWYLFSFKVLRNIRGLNLYSGVEWYALFNNIFRQHIKGEFADEHICVLPAENGRHTYYQNEIVNVCLGFDQHNLRAIEKGIEDLKLKEEWKLHDKHLIPGKTIELVAAENLITKKYPEYEIINEEVIEKEVQSLKNAQTIKIVLLSPLRLKRPEGYKEASHVYYDPYFFDIKHFLKTIAQNSDIVIKDADIEGIRIIRKNFLWIDVPYKKTLGGILGGLELDGSFPDSIKKTLAAGQYCGLGKSNSFGFGFYRIVQSDSLNNVISERKGVISYLFSEENIHNVIKRMPNDTRGAFGVIPNDLYLDKNYVSKLSDSIIGGLYKIGDIKSFRKRKSDGSYREIIMNTLVDKIVQKVLHDHLHETLNNQLADNCYSYRKGYDYHKAIRAVYFQFKKGFTQGLLADIRRFFDSIIIQNLELLLMSFFSGSRLVQIITSYFTKNYLYQGNTISPILSNFFLASFDTAMQKMAPKVRMIRYADDIILFAKDPNIDLKILLEERLKSTELDLNEDKISIFTPDDEISWLGSKISKRGFFQEKTRTSKIADMQDWLPVFLYKSLEQKPLYITFGIQYARTQGNFIVIQKHDGTVSKLNWNEVNRIVILGKARISAGIITRALYLKKGVVFLTALGKLIGGFNNFGKTKTVYELFNDAYIDWEIWSEKYIKELAKSKLNNQIYILKRNGINSKVLKDYIAEIENADNADSVRGYEGVATKEYYKHFRKIVHPFPFKKRVYHPPEGPINAMLSVFYTLIYRRFVEIFLSSGINAYVGIFHAERGNHRALASDIMESFRFLAERNVIALIRLKQVKINDFEERSYNNKFTKTVIKQNVMRAIIHRFERTMNTTMTFESKKFTYGELMDFMVHRFKVCLYLGIPYTPFTIAR